MKMATVVVLGCGFSVVRGVGSPSPMMKGRLDRALALYRTLSSSRSVTLLLSGRGRQCVSEAEVMAEYLLERDVPATDILKEDRSMNTIENCLESSLLIYETFFAPERWREQGHAESEDGEREKVKRVPVELHIVTSCFHIARTRTIFEHFRLGELFRVTFVEAETPAEEKKEREDREKRNNTSKRLRTYDRDAVLLLYKGLRLKKTPYAPSLLRGKKEDLYIAPPRYRRLESKRWGRCKKGYVYAPPRYRSSGTKRWKRKDSQES